MARLAVPPRPGRGLEGIRIERLVVRLGARDVYQAVDDSDGTSVAVDIATGYRANTEAAATFARAEIARLATIDSPGIARPLRCGLTEELEPAVVSELVVGERLSQRLEAGVSVADAISLGRRMLDALAIIHAAGALHLAVHPGAIAMRRIEAGVARPVLTGLALGPAVAAALTDGVVSRTSDAGHGALSFPPPESAAEHVGADVHADLWAAAVVFYLLVLGQRPEGATLQQVLSGKMPDASLRRRGVPRELDQVFRRALAPRRSDRYPSADALRSAIVSAWADHRAAGVGRLEQRAARRLGVRDERERPADEAPSFSGGEAGESTPTPH
jgi:serine/threonine-protein kinase